MINRIEITNFKSIEHAKLCIAEENIVGFLGKNGTGKSTLFYAVQYFFSKLNKQYSDDLVIDSVNPYVQTSTITLSFNLKSIIKRTKYNPELSQIISCIHEYQETFLCGSSDVLSITMTQYRDGRISWNIDKKYREKILNAIKRFFPVYFINVRNLDLQSWDKLWDIIGDLLMSVPQESEEHLEKLDEAFSKIYGDRYSKSKQKIEETFKKENITLDQYNFSSRFKDVFKLRFGGEQFEFNERNLDYYSDGTNSFKYLKLLISLIPYVSELSCKFPLVMIDEPEIGLHSAFITELVECIRHNIQDKALLLFTTHSPKVIEELTNQEIEYTLYRTSEHRLHTVFKKLNLQWLKEGNHTVSIKETECYFSDYLVYVEGESEVQLFQNKYLRRLFPKLRKIHFYPAGSDNQKMHNVNSDGLNLGIEYRIVIDMDKVICLTKDKTGFELKQDPLNPLLNFTSKQFDFYDYPRHVSMSYEHELKKKIDILLKKKYDTLNKDYIEDENFNQVMRLIQLFCFRNRTIVNWSTIEGELITYENIEIFIEFLKMKLTNIVGYKDEHGRYVEKKCESSVLRKLNRILLLEDVKQKAVLLLYSCNGKLEMIGNKPAHPFSEIKQGVIGGKAGGWINDWLTYYFEKYMRIESVSELEAKNEFIKHFPGLSRTLQELENMVQ